MSRLLNLIKNLHLLELPSSLWAPHIDPEQKYLAIVRIDIKNEKISVDQTILLDNENDNIRTSVSLNDRVIQLPAEFEHVETISDLNRLISGIQEVQLCSNFNSDLKCTRYVFCKSSDLCKYCIELYIQENLVPANTNYYEEPDKKRFLCTDCGKAFTSPSGLNDHMLIHNKDKPFKCEMCMKSFAKKYNLNVHIRVHSGERPYMCTKCGKTYSTRSNLSTHMNSTHLKEKRHQCDLCERSFVHPRVLKIHMRKHTGEKPFLCNLCGKGFAKKVHLTIHLRTHTGEKPYICSLCGRSFTTSGNLNSHVKVKHNKIT